MQYDIAIIGAGAAGLMAMHDLASAGYRVCMLEASDVAGGRIATRKNAAGEIIETGAEFIHGKTSITADLLNLASIPYYPTAGKMISVRNGVWMGERINETDFKIFSQRLQSLENDTTIAEFFADHLPEREYEEVRTAARQFAEGFSLADINKASVFAFRKEWTHQQDEQYRISGGYDQLVQYLLNESLRHNAAIYYRSPVDTIQHQAGLVTIQAKDRRVQAKKLIITVSAGVLQSGIIRFEPALAGYDAHFKSLGFGSVAKILLHFKEAFWREQDDDIGFLLSDEEIPTWWTQAPSPAPLLTGWLGGPPAITFAALKEELQLEKIFSSLSVIFHRDISYLRQQVLDCQVVCWHNNPFTCGGYSYLTLESALAKKALAEPVNNTIYFAGEALYQGNLQGTVEAALVTGRQAAEKISGRKH